MSATTPVADDLVINTAALEPLFAPWEEPDKHRVRAQQPVSRRRSKSIGGLRQSAWSIACALP